MKKIFPAIFFLCILWQTSSAQTSWELTSKSDFMGLIPLFADTLQKDLNSKLPSISEEKVDNSISAGFMLSKGTWKGFSDGVYGGDNLEFIITQDSPYIKGFYRMIVEYIESQDTLRGELRGKRSYDDGVIIALGPPQKKDPGYGFIRGHVYKID